MANNWQINAIAGLDGTQSRNQLNSDIKGLSRNLDKLKLYTEIDKNQVTQLQHQLKNLQVQLNNVTVSDAVINGLVAKINAGLQNVNITNINVGNVGQQISQNIANAVNSQKVNINPDLDLSQNEKKIEQFKESLAELGTVDSKYVDKLSERFNKLGIQIQSINASLSEVAVHEKGEYKGTNEILSSTLRGIDKYGQAITLTESWNLTNHEFVRSLDGVGASFEQASKYVTDYEVKLNNLKTKYSNLNMDYSGFENMLNNFRNGIGTVDDLKLALNTLENTAKSSVQSLKSQSSSFDPIQQTLNNMRDLPSRLQALQADMGGLKDKTAMADISIEDLTSEYQKLQSVMTNSGGKVPLADNWTESYRNLMSTLTSAENQVKALKKAEASDNSQITKQANYYSTILSNYRQIYSLKQKLLTAGKEETNVIKEQIRSLSASNASINKQLGVQGLKSKDWESEVSGLKEQLRYSYMISEAKQKDITNTKKQSDAQKQSAQMTKELATAYQKLGNLKVQKSSFDTSKDAEKIAQLTQEIQKASQAYSNLYNTFRKRKNFDSSSWKETKSAIDSAIKSQIEYNNAKSKDVFNSAKNNEISNLTTLKSKWQEQGVLIGEFKTKVEQLESSLTNVGNKGELDKLTSQIRNLKSEASTIAEINKIQLLSNGGIKNDYATQIAKLEGDFRSLGLAQDTIANKTQNVKNSLTTLRAEFAKPVDQQNFQAIQTANDNLQRELIESRNEFEQLRASMKGMATEQQRLSLANTIEAWNQKNTAATKAVREQNEKYIATLRDLNTQMTKMQYSQINTSFKQAENSMRALNKLGASLKNQLIQAGRSFTTWLSASTMVMTLVSKIRQIPREVIAVNSAMVELRKVTDASENDFKNYFDEAAESAKKLGASISDLISATADWSRLGYSLDDSKKLAEIATLYKNVGDGIDIETANQSLVSTLRGFQMEAEQAIDIVNVFNEVANNMPISSGGIGDALQRSASSMYAAGNTLEETVALITAANSVVQDPDSIGRVMPI